ncbi:MAG TPA: metallophosphoesterase [Terriglobales bacterium]|nr:metallophosphoesterase [Terriglobales bacterium]
MRTVDFGMLTAVLLGACNLVSCGGGSSSPNRVSTIVETTAPAAFAGTVLLGSPTNTSVKANLLASDQAGSVYIAYGTDSAALSKQTPAAALGAGKPLEIALDQLSSGTKYFYRVYLQSTGASSYLPSPLYTFHTARHSNETFTFTVQADSHLDENSDLDLYRRTLANVLADVPDFHIDLGDTFMCEKHCSPLTAVLQPPLDQSTVDSRYIYERGNFGIFSHSAPLFLVNGNHEGEMGFLADGSPENLTVWASRARKTFFANPVPDTFYSGDLSEEPYVGKRASWYSWIWGDALFIVLDPYWNTLTKSNEGWNYTLGDAQYQWLHETLASAQTKFKFVFVHSLIGGLDGQMRGGIEAAPYFEWGGRDLDGTWSFSRKRPTWDTPIHELLVRYRVTAVFHGHDHIYAQQELDGVIYQEVPQPSARNTSSGPALAAAYHYATGSISSSAGHLRITVSPDHVTSQYVRAWLPAAETDQRKNGQIDASWTILAE